MRINLNSKTIKYTLDYYYVCDAIRFSFYLSLFMIINDKIESHLRLHNTFALKICYVCDSAGIYLSFSLMFNKKYVRDRSIVTCEFVDWVVMRIGLGLWINWMLNLNEINGCARYILHVNILFWVLASSGEYYFENFFLFLIHKLTINSTCMCLLWNFQNIFIRILQYYSSNRKKSNISYESSCTLYKMKWNEMRWNEMRWDETKWF